MNEDAPVDPAAKADRYFERGNELADEFFETTETDVEGIAAPAAPALFSDREHATILAALRHWQRHQANSVGVSNNAIPEDDVATNGGTLSPMRANEIDGLCDRLNLTPASV